MQTRFKQPRRKKVPLIVETEGGAMYPVAKARPRALEDKLQIAVFNQLKPLMALQKSKQFSAFHVPNGGKRSKATAGKFKAMGVMPGVPDIILLFPQRPAGYVLANPIRAVMIKPKTVFIELKVKGGSQEQSQKDFQALVEGFGFEYYVIKGDPYFPKPAIDAVFEILRANGVTGI